MQPDTRIWPWGLALDGLHRLTRLNASLILEDAMARLIRTTIAAVLLPVVLLSLGGTSFASWRCRYDGIARSACCCPDAGDPAHAPAIRAQDCCDFEHYVAPKTPSDVSRVESLLTPPVRLSASMAAPMLETVAPSRAGFRLADERPPGGRSVVLLKHAFLI
jgi:hypothetical protein